MAVPNFLLTGRHRSCCQTSVKRPTQRSNGLSSSEPLTRESTQRNRQSVQQMDTHSHKGICACNASGPRRGDSYLGSDQDLSFVINRIEDNYSSDGQIGKGEGDPLFLKLYCNFSLRPRGIFSLSPNLRVYLFFP